MTNDLNTIPASVRDKIEQRKRELSTYWNCFSYPLTQGYWTLVDVDDYDIVSSKKWSISKGCAKMIYARANLWLNGKRTAKNLHQLLFGDTGGLMIDHINRDSLDNRRKNLRLCTHAENCRNKGATGTTSKYKGVTIRHGRKNQWAACIQIGDKYKRLGSFATEHEAALAYNAAAIKRDGEFAWLNDVPALAALKEKP